MTTIARKWCLIAVTLFAAPAILEACLWDSDTLVVERARFPSTLELITGFFPRHTPAYYEWRIEDRLKRLEQDPDQLDLLDDLAVAYDKLGRGEEAIAVMEKKERIKPGLYETAANLGTFRIHSGDLEGGLVEIARALEINPHAHFDREVYQHYLVQYVLKHRVDGKLQLPLSQSGESFDQYLASQLAAKAKGEADKKRDEDGEDETPAALAMLTIEQRAAAVNGVLGIMRFGTHDSPILLEALGSLLVAKFDNKDAKQLASRAYLRAAESVKDKETKDAYLKLAETALEMQVVPGSGHKQVTLAAIQKEFQKERIAADRAQAKVAANELRWIKTGRDVDAEFQKLYLTPRRTSHLDFRRPALGGLLAVSLIAVVVIAVTRRRSAQKIDSQSTQESFKS